jgi:hypothetical protein
MQATMTTAEAAAALGLSPSGIAYRVRRGQLTPLLKAPGLRGAYVFSRSTVERLIPRERREGGMTVPRHPEASAARRDDRS